MADLSDVTALIASLVTQAVYPNGSGSVSVSGKPVRVMEGWPLPEPLGADMQNGVSNVSIFPMKGAIFSVPQLIEKSIVVTPAQHGVSATISDQAITFAGAPGPQEYVSIIADGRRCYSRAGGSLSAILSALLADIQVNYSSASLAGDILTIPNTHALTVRIGANAVMGRLICREAQRIMITVWSPNPADRTTLAKPIDVLLKQNLRITLPDTSQAIMVYERTDVDDSEQVRNIYRRNLIYDVTYGTIETFDAYEITSVSSAIDQGDGSGAIVTPVS